jgi:hypothetical protein
MLSAAAVALLSGPAMAVGPTTITTTDTKSHKTSVDGDLTINSGAGIAFKSDTIPIITIDSSNSVNNGGILQGSGTTGETVLTIDTTAAALGTSALPIGFTNNGTIDLTGAGAQKTALLLTGGNAFNGNIIFDTGSIVNIVGDSSTGVATAAGSIMNGDLVLGGTFAMAPTTANEGTASGIALANLFGTINGNVVISQGASYSATGNTAQGITIAGAIHAGGAGELGSFVNAGTLAVAGVATRSTTAKNAESGAALIIGNSIDGGILNQGQTFFGDTTVNATISGNGTGTSSAVIVFAPQTATGAFTIGKDTIDTNGDYSFINRGAITATPVDPNVSARAVLIAGGQNAIITFAGGFFNSGSLTAQASSTATTSTSDVGSAVTAVAMEVDSYVTIPEIRISAQSSDPTTASTNGLLAAAVSGPLGGSAVGILITGSPVDDVNGVPQIVTKVDKITIEKGARLVVNATVTDPTNVDAVSLAAIGIRDTSNSLKVLNNLGTLSATATTLTNGHTSIANAVDTSLNASQGLFFTNNGSVTGNVFLGGGDDTYLIQGTAVNAVATHSGAINFGGSTAAGGDFLHVAQFANVAGSITSQGTLDVQVDGNGTLTVQNVGTTMATRDFTVAGGTTTTNSGTVNITVSQATGVPVISASHQAELNPNANLTVQYGSFITAGGSFTLISAPIGGLIVSPSDVARYNAQIGGAATPFLFSSASIVEVPDDGAGHSLLRLAVVPKTAAQLGLTGYGKALFTIANTAVATDAPLGAAMIAGINSQTDAQKAYDSFAPDLSGGARNIAISLTDQATGVVAARQRALRMFGKQPGDLTLWGNEFGEYISTKGGTVASSDPAVLNSGAAPGFKDHGFGFSLGMDEGAANTGWYGAAFTFYTGDIAEGGDRTAKTSTLWYLLTAYSDWRGKGLFIDSQLNLGYGNLKGKRVIDLTIPGSTTTPSSIFSREADSKRAALLASIGVTAGAMLKYGSLTAIPQISLDGMAMREEGYTEINGGSGFNLTVKPYYANSLRIFLGSEFREDINVGDFYLQPSMRLGYRYDLLNDPVKLKAAFADLNTTTAGLQPGTEFTLQGPDPARGNYVAGLNLAATTENWTIGLNYDFVRGSNNATEQVGTLSLLGRI